MKTLSIKSKPMTAAQYLDACQYKRDKAACQWLDIKDKLFCGVCAIFATTAICVCIGGLIQIAILFAQ